MNNELDKYASTYNTESGKINQDINSVNVVELIKLKGLIGGSAIQMGMGDGYVALQLHALYDKFTVLEGSKLIVEQYNNSPFEVIHTYFENFETDFKYDFVLGNHILEHVDNPITVLKNSLNWLKPGGKAIFTVPNANSLHRRIGVEMGLLKKLNDFNEQDIALGHQRVYTLDELKNDIVESGYTIIEDIGYMIKLVSNKQMKDWDQNLFRAIFKISLSIDPNLCSNIGVICIK